MPVFISKPIRYKEQLWAPVWMLIWILIITNLGLWYYASFHKFTSLNWKHFANNAAERRPEVFVMTKSQIAGYIASQAQLEGLDPIKVLRIIKCESQFNNLATNKKSSARGLAQITLATQKEVEKNTGKKFDVFKPEDNIEMAFYFMKKTQWRRWECK